MLDYEWESTKSPAGAPQWTPKADSGAPTAPTAGDASKRQALMMTDADMALKVDPEFLKISQHFKANPEAFEDAFARAWYKLTHRDMGPISRYLGPEVPSEELIWQDVVPTGNVLSDAEVATLKNAIANSGLSVSQMVTTAWASASTFRHTDKRGGANGARIRLEPQRSWEVNNPAALEKVLAVYEKIQGDFAGTVSIADLIVLGGSVGVETAAKSAGHNVTVPFSSGRGDATQEQTEIESFKFLEPQADGFRNYAKGKQNASAEDLLVDRAQLLDLSIPEMTALVGGLRVLGANYNDSKVGVFTDREGQLTNDFFVNILDFTYTWAALSSDDTLFSGTDRRTGALKFTGSRADLIFGSNTELRAVSEVYASNDGEARFVNDFVKAFVKVMNADRFDI